MGLNSGLAIGCPGSLGAASVLRRLVFYIPIEVVDVVPGT